MPLECDHIRNEFSALLDNELNPEDRELVEEHLSDCSDCLRELHGYKVVSDAYRYHHPVKAPDDFEERFHAAIAPIGRRRGRVWQRWGLAAAAGFTLVAGLAFWQSQSRLQQAMSPELASSMAAEGAPAVEAPQTMMFQAPSGGAGPEIALDQSVADSTVANGEAREVGLMREDSRQALEAQPEGQALEFGVEPKSSDAPGSETEHNSGLVAAGTGDGAVAMSAPAPPAAPAESAPIQAARKVDENSAVAMKSEVAERPVRATEASPAPLRWNEQTFELIDGTWRQSDYANEPLTKIAVPSTNWNALLDQHPDLAALCDRAEPVIVKLGDVWYTISKAPTE